MIVKKKPLILFILALLGVEILLWFLIESVYFKNASGLAKTLLWGIAPLLLSLFFLIFFRHKVFKNWLYYIASWYIPLSIALVVVASSYSSTFLVVQSSLLAEQVMIGLFIITVIYATAQTLYDRSKNKRIATDA